MMIKQTACGAGLQIDFISIFFFFSFFCQGYGHDRYVDSIDTSSFQELELYSTMYISKVLDTEMYIGWTNKTNVQA